MPQQELLVHVVKRLEELGIDYMVTGSIASSLQGQPRSTHDIDLVVALRPEQAGQLAEAFPPPDYYLAKEAIDVALRDKSMFNLLWAAEGDKIDFWILTDEPFDQTRFSRKQALDVLGLKLRVCTPEDTILAKLRWAKLLGGSEKQFTDALHVFEVQRDQLDLPYLNHWAKQLSVEDSWGELQGKADVP